VDSRPHTGLLVGAHCSAGPMPMLINTDQRTRELVRAINEILADCGPPGLTMRRIADLSGVSTSSILHHLGSREHLLRVAAGATGRARIVSLTAEIELDGALAFLPRSDDELLDARTWLAWLELWRCEGFLGRWIEESRADELALLAHTTDYRLTKVDLVATLALVDGLRVAMCAPRDPMRRDDARSTLAAWLHVPLTPIPPGAESPWWTGWAAG
jgi:AcrR family transcriptional regulator